MRTAIISTYPPRACGIGTFAADVRATLLGVAGIERADLVAVVNEPSSPQRLGVLATIAQNVRGDYVRTARMLDRLDVDVVLLQHEYGIFGGPSGAHLLDFLDALTVPVVTTLHTILAHPTPLQRRILERLAERSARLVSMSERGRDILVEGYGVPVDRIKVIPHGVPDFTALDPALAKARIGVGDGPLILSFGLLGPHKRLGLVIDDDYARLLGGVALPAQRLFYAGSVAPPSVSSLRPPTPRLRRRPRRGVRGPDRLLSGPVLLRPSRGGGEHEREAEQPREGRAVPAHRVPRPHGTSTSLDETKSPARKYTR